MNDQQPILLDYAPAQPRPMRASALVTLAIGGAGLLIAGGTCATYALRWGILGKSAPARIQWQQKPSAGQPAVKKMSDDSSSPEVRQVRVEG